MFIEWKECLNVEICLLFCKFFVNMKLKNYPNVHITDTTSKFQSILCKQGKLFMEIELVPPSQIKNFIPQTRKPSIYFHLFGQINP